MILWMKIKKILNENEQIEFEQALEDIEKQESYKDDDNMNIDKTKYNI